MSKAVLLVYTNPPEGKEQEFNHWYDTMHVPDILAVEGFTGAQRFKLSGPGPQTVTRDGQPAVAQYLALYEMDSDDTRAAMKRLNETVADLQRRGRMLDGLQIVSAATYVAVGEPQTAG
jgi:hypothetical protein